MGMQEISQAGLRPRQLVGNGNALALDFAVKHPLFPLQVFFWTSSSTLGSRTGALACCSQVRPVPTSLPAWVATLLSLPTLGLFCPCIRVRVGITAQSHRCHPHWLCPSKPQLLFLSNKTQASAHVGMRDNREHRAGLEPTTVTLPLGSKASLVPGILAQLL